MIIEITIAGFLLLSFIGIILFTRYFFKHKKHVDRKREEPFVERTVNEEIS
jgi:hypothetical protein